MNGSSQQSILIVDDDPKNIKILFDILRQDGLQIAVAKSGESALSKVAKSLPDLILLDALMPGIDGFETCRRLKADPKTRSIPVIFLSALDDVAKKVEAFKIGGVDYITKPFQVEEVLARVRTQLTLRATQAQMRQLSEVVENASEGIARLDERGCYLTVNAAYADILGYQPEATIGMEWQATIHPDDLEKMQAAYRQMRLDGNVEVEAKGVRKDGSIFYQQVVMTIVRDDREQFIGHYAFMKDITERKRREEILRNIALGVSAEIGEAFFRSLVRYLTKALGVEYAFIGELIKPQSDRIRIIAGYLDGRIIENFAYPLAHTPCEKVIGQRVRVYPAKVRELFPRDSALAKIAAESYLGIPLFDSENRPLGLIAIISRRSLLDARLMEESLKIFAVRVSSELERQQAEAKLHLQNRRSQLFAEIALKIRRSWQLDEILQTTVNEVKKLLDADRVLILRFESPGKIRVVKEAVESEDLSVINLSPECQKQYCQEGIDNILGVEPTSPDVTKSPIDSPEENRIQSKLVIPILLHDELWGKIVVHQCFQSREWSAFEIDLLEQLANQVGIALAQNQSQERFRCLIENASDLIILLDATGIVHYASPSIWRILGVTPEAAIARPLSTLLHPEDKQIAAQVFNCVLCDPEVSLCIELRCQERQGNWQIFEVLAKQYRDSTGFVGVVLNFRDIAVRRELERERELSALKLRFFSMASHEFRTPLSIILMAAQVLELSSSEWLDAKKLRNIHRIQDAAKSLRQMLGNVLTLARLEAEETLTFNPQPLNLRSFCYRLLDEIAASLVSDSPIDFTYIGETERVCMDEKLLHSISLDLLWNAVKYSPPGNRVTFEVIVEAKTAVFSVRDRGIGIPARDREQLFEPFHRGENVDNIEGSGLGLAIVKKCVDLHGGEISFESVVGEGTTFTVRFPIASVN